MLKEFGGILIFLLILVIFGNIWFHFVESVLDKIKKIFCRRKEPVVWHTLPQEKEKEQK